MYQDKALQESIKKVEAARAENVKLNPRRMTAEEKDVLLRTFHPDYRDNQFTTLHIGANKGEKVPLELCALLEGQSRLAGREEEYDALVFACGDAMPKFAENADKPFNREMLRIMKRFAEQGKPMIGHCAAALLYDNLGIARGRRVALHPFLKTVVRECIPTDDKAVVDGNFYTAQTENALSELMPQVLQALK